MTYQLTMALHVETSWSLMSIPTIPPDLFYRSNRIYWQYCVVSYRVLYIPRLSEIVSCRLPVPHLNWITKNLKMRIRCSKAFCLLTVTISPCTESQHTRVDASPLIATTQRRSNVARNCSRGLLTEQSRFAVTGRKIKEGGNRAHHGWNARKWLSEEVHWESSERPVEEIFGAPAVLGRWRDQQGRMADSSDSIHWGSELWSQTNCPGSWNQLLVLPTPDPQWLVQCNWRTDCRVEHKGMLCIQ